MSRWLRVKTKYLSQKTCWIVGCMRLAISMNFAIAWFVIDSFLSIAIKTAMWQLEKSSDPCKIPHANCRGFSMSFFTFCLWRELSFTVPLRDGFGLWNRSRVCVLRATSSSSSFFTLGRTRPSACRSWQAFAHWQWLDRMSQVHGHIFRTSVTVVFPRTDGRFVWKGNSGAKLYITFIHLTYDWNVSWHVTPMTTQLYDLILLMYTSSILSLVPRVQK